MFEVTKEHIENGKKNDRDFCPVALCVKDHFQDIMSGNSLLIDQENNHYVIPVVLIRSGHLYCTIPINEYARKKRINTYLFSNELRSWVRDFDTSKEVPRIRIQVEKDRCYIQENTNDDI